MNYTIKKGKHYSRPFKLKFLFGKFHQFTGKILKGSWYHPEILGKQGVNKIGGIGYFPHHIFFSIRLGYMCNKQNGTFDLYLYIRNWGKFYFEKIGSVKTDELFSLRIFYGRYVQVLKYSKDCRIKVLYDGEVKVSFISWVSYMLRPYHGGKDPAPRDQDFHWKIVV